MKGNLTLETIGIIDLVLLRVRPVHIHHHSDHFDTQELGGKPKWLPLKFGYHDVIHTAPNGNLPQNSPKHKWSNFKLAEKVHHVILQIFAVVLFSVVDGVTAIEKSPKLEKYIE